MTSFSAISVICVASRHVNNVQTPQNPLQTAPKTGVTARRTAFKGLLSLFAKNNGRCSNSYYCYCHCYLPSYYCYYYYTHIHTKTPVVAPTTTGTTESFHTHAPCRKST